MTQHTITHSLGRFFGLVALLAAFSAFSHAQAAATTQGGVAGGSVDLAGNVGWSNLEGADNNYHINYGGSGGYNISPWLTVLGEYQFLPMGSVTDTSSGTAITAHASYDLYGGAARFNFSGSKRFVPYGLVAMGGARLKGTGAAEGVSISAAINGYYVGFGGGTSVYLGRNWGVRPEVRYERQVFSVAGTASSQNAVLTSCGVFFRFGGKG